MIIKLETSARHIHLNALDLAALCGPEATLTQDFPLSQPGEFASVLRLKILGANGKFLQARVIGPLRQHSQVEISLSDANYLGLTPTLRLSGDLRGSAAVTLEGPLGRVKLRQGLIAAKRHLHLDSATASKLNIASSQTVSAQIAGERAVTFHNIIVRISDNFIPAIHIDTDEANAAGLTGPSEANLLIT